MTFDGLPLTMDDLGAWAELLAEVEAEDRTGENYGVGDLADQLRSSLVDPVEGTLAVWDGGALAAFGVLFCRASADPVHSMSLWCAVRPGRRRRGLGRHLMRWAVRAAPAVHERRFPGRPLEISSHVDDRNAGARAVVTEAGMVASRWFRGMGRDLSPPLPPAALPGGLKIVPYTEDLAEAALRVRNEAFADHWGSMPHTPESWRSVITGVDAFRPEATFLALEESGRGVALLLTHFFAAHTEVTGVREAWIQIIGTLADWRGRGVASALLAHALAEFRAQGYHRAGLSVDAGNTTGALRVYTRAGFAVERRVTAYVLSIGEGGRISAGG